MKKIRQLTVVAVATAAAASLAAAPAQAQSAAACNAYPKTPWLGGTQEYAYTSGVAQGCSTSAQWRIVLQRRAFGYWQNMDTDYWTGNVSNRYARYFCLGDGQDTWRAILDRLEGGSWKQIKISAENTFVC